MAKTKIKKEEAIDLKPKAEKISEEQLAQLQSLVSNVNKVKFDLGTMEAQKHSMLHGLTAANDAIIKLQKDFEKEHGTFDINIQDGTINNPKNGEVNKKN